MADYRLSAKIIGRSSGRSSVAAAAYRSGAELHDERTGLDHDFTRKGGVLHSEILAPDNAPDWMKDRAKLWNAVEAVERRKDAQLAREIQLSLPHEMDERQRHELLFGFVQSHFVDRGMIADIAIHAPDRGGDQRNHHAHVMLTMRELTSDGFGKKNREWNTPDQLKDWRKNWADHQNEVFQELGLKPRVDHRSYADQGVDREPTQHLGPVANDMEKNGKASRVGEENRERQERNAERAALAQEAAQVSQELAAEKARQEEHTNLNKALMQTHLLHDEIEMDRRHSRQTHNLDADLQRRNGERLQQLEAERQKLDALLQADGLRKLMRDMLGKTRRDREDLEANRLNLENIRMREAEERQALQSKQEAERATRIQSEQQRKQDQDLKLEQDRTATLEQTRDAPEPVKTNEPANDRSQPQWERPHAPEQDNRGKGSQDFQKAATAAPVPSPAPLSPEDKKAQLMARMKAAREQSRGRGNDGMDNE